MSYIIRIVSRADGKPTISDGEYVRSCDPEANGGLGDLVTTRERATALHFGTLAEAARFYGRQSMVRPLRPDGRPNKPLTAFTVVIEPDPSIQETT